LHSNFDQKWAIRPGWSEGDSRILGSLWASFDSNSFFKTCTSTINDRLHRDNGERFRIGQSGVVYRLISSATHSSVAPLQIEGARVEAAFDSKFVGRIQSHCCQSKVNLTYQKSRLPIQSPLSVSNVPLQYQKSRLPIKSHAYLSKITPTCPKSCLRVQSHAYLSKVTPTCPKFSFINADSYARVLQLFSVYAPLTLIIQACPSAWN
jgi:hypothetical protein